MLTSADLLQVELCKLINPKGVPGIQQTMKILGPEGYIVMRILVGRCRCLVSLLNLIRHVTNKYSSDTTMCRLQAQNFQAVSDILVSTICIGSLCCVHKLRRSLLFNINFGTVKHGTLRCNRVACCELETLILLTRGHRTWQAFLARKSGICICKGVSMCALCSNAPSACPKL